MTISSLAVAEKILKNLILGRKQLLHIALLPQYSLQMCRKEKSGFFSINQYFVFVSQGQSALFIMQENSSRSLDTPLYFLSKRHYSKSNSRVIELFKIMKNAVKKFQEVQLLQKCVQHVSTHFFLIYINKKGSIVFIH